MRNVSKGAFKDHLVVEINILVINQIKDTISSSQAQPSIPFFKSSTRSDINSEL